MHSEISSHFDLPKRIIKMGSSLLGGDLVTTLRVRHFVGKNISPTSGLTAAVNPHLYYWGRTLCPIYKR